MSKLTQLLGAGLVVAAMMFLVPTTQAEVIKIDFGAEAGILSNTDPGAGDVWNNWTRTAEHGIGNGDSFANLVDTTGAETAVTATINYDEGLFGSHDQSHHDPGLSVPGYPDSAVAGVHFWSADSGGEPEAALTLTFTGLAANTFYDISVLDTLAESGAPRPDQAISVNGGAPQVFPVRGNTTPAEFPNAASDADGQIVVLVAAATDPGADAVYLNAMTLEKGAPVPEPATMALLGLGGLAMIRRRRA